MNRRWQCVSKSEICLRVVKMVCEHFSHAASCTLMGTLWKVLPLCLLENILQILQDLICSDCTVVTYAIFPIIPALVVPCYQFPIVRYNEKPTRNTCCISVSLFSSHAHYIGHDKDTHKNVHLPKSPQCVHGNDYEPSLLPLFV